MTSTPATPWLLRWQGLLAAGEQSRLRRWLATLAGGLLTALLLLLPLADRGGLGLLISACGLLWLVWGLATPTKNQPLGALNGWILAYLALAVLATGFSPVPAAAAKGLLKLFSYLGVYALMRRLLNESPAWWDRLLAGLLLGELATAVIGLRQLHSDTQELARWADPNSVADGTRRIYSSLENPNLLAGYLVPILPLAVVALLRWRGLWPRLLALTSLICGAAALLFTYSRGGWIGLLVSLGALGLMLLLRQTRHLSPLLRRLLPPLVITAVIVALVLAALKVEPLRVRLLSMVAGREDSSNNFRINVWMAALQMIHDRPWLGIGPGNSAFNLIYPLYQQPRFTALSAYSVPLELAVETGILGLLVGLGLLVTSLRLGWYQLQRELLLSLPALGALAAVLGMASHGIVDTIFFRPEVQMTGWFALATLGAAQSLMPSHRH
jgi:putative inorganic carbon (HCO3(-)) transporter